MEAAERKRAAMEGNKNAQRDAADSDQIQSGHCLEQAPPAENNGQISSAHCLEQPSRQQNNENRATAILAAKAGVGRATMEKVESLVRARPDLAKQA